MYDTYGQYGEHDVLLPLGLLLVSRFFHIEEFTSSFVHRITSYHNSTIRRLNIRSSWANVNNNKTSTSLHTLLFILI